MQIKLVLLVTFIVTIHSYCFAINSSSTNPDTTDYAMYAGTYRYPDASPVPFIRIVLKNGKLYASADGFPETQLFQKEKDVFIDSVYGAEFAFARNGARVDTVRVDANGAILLGVRSKEDLYLRSDPNDLPDRWLRLSVALNRRKI